MSLYVTGFLSADKVKHSRISSKREIKRQKKRKKKKNKKEKKKKKKIHNK